MAMKADVIEACLRARFPQATITLKDLVGDGDHYQVEVIDQAFVGLTRIAQHKLVYTALKGKVGGELHALSIITRIPA